MFVSPSILFYLARGGAPWACKSTAITCRHAARIIPAIKLLLSIRVMSPSTYTSNEERRNRQGQQYFWANSRLFAVSSLA
jgi:hypothetical protein